MIAMGAGKACQPSLRAARSHRTPDDLTGSGGTGDGRRVHPGSGRTYHVKFNPPKQEGRDDVTSEPLVQRDDDREETVRHRLEVYRRQTLPLVGYYRRWATSGEAGAPKYHKISGLGTVEEIKQRAFAALR